MAFISPPKHIPLLLRLGLSIARKITGKDLLPPRLLAWYPRAAVSSGIMESLVSHGEGRLTERLIRLVRMTVSFTVGCPFCMDMNTAGWEKFISPDELSALQGKLPMDNIPSFSSLERLAMQYARLISLTPLSFPQSLRDTLKSEFTEREIVILATTAAQVNYWARLIQALGCPPANFNHDLSLIIPLPIGMEEQNQ